MKHELRLRGHDPARRLNLNDRDGHQYLRVKTNQAKKEWRRMAWALANSVRKPKITGMAVVQIRFGTDRPNQRRDPGNWSPVTKHCVDGLTDAGLWSDDDSRHVATLEPTFTSDLGAREFEIIITWEDPT